MTAVINYELTGREQKLRERGTVKNLVIEQKSVFEDCDGQQQTGGRSTDLREPRQIQSPSLSPITHDVIISLKNDTPQALCDL